jgi:hypothetical protein
MAAENCLWGAPRIHGELLKLSIAISERTVSRYLRGRPTTRSQTWRTFFANRFGDQTFISPLMFAEAHDDDIVIDASDLSFRSAPSINKSCTSIRGPSFDWCVGSNPRPLASVSVKNHLEDRTGARKSNGRDPPQHLPSRWSRGLLAGVRSIATNARARSFARREFTMGNPQSLLLRHQVVTIARRPNTSFGPRCGCFHAIRHGGRNIGDAQPRGLRP